MPLYNQRIQWGESTDASSCVRASQPGSSHRAFSPLGTLPATEANEDLSEAVMFADMSKDGRQDGGKELGGEIQTVQFAARHLNHGDFCSYPPSPWKKR